MSQEAQLAVATWIVMPREEGDSTHARGQSLKTPRDKPSRYWAYRRALMHQSALTQLGEASVLDTSEHSNEVAASGGAPAFRTAFVTLNQR